MKKYINIAAALVALILYSGCTSTPVISSNKIHLDMSRELESLMENGSDRVKIVLNEKSGTSVYMIIYLCQSSSCQNDSDYKLLGAILPENSSTKVTGEIFSYNLARVLGLDRYFGPGAHFTLKGQGLKKFSVMIRAARYRGQKEDNRKKLIELTDRSNCLYCAYKQWGPVPYDLDKLETDNMLNKNNRLSRFLVAENPKPSNIIIKMSEISSCRKKGSANAVELSKQLSGIFLIDMLTGQWDRFSGGNLQATIINGNLSLASFDNGGTFSFYPTSEWFDKYKSIVSRFDRTVCERIIAMNNFLNTKTIDRFLQYNSEKEFRQKMGVIYGPDNLSNADWIWEKFKNKLSKLVEYIRSVELKYGSEQCYFN